MSDRLSSIQVGPGSFGLTKEERVTRFGIVIVSARELRNRRTIHRKIRKMIQDYRPELWKLKDMNVLIVHPMTGLNADSTLTAKRLSGGAFSIASELIVVYDFNDADFDIYHSKSKTISSGVRTLSNYWKSKKIRMIIFKIIIHLIILNIDVI